MLDRTILSRKSWVPYTRLLIKYLAIASLPWQVDCLCSIALAKQPIVNGIGNIQNNEETAGCWLQQKGKKEYVFWSAVESALMNIDGKDRVFKFVSETPSDQQIEKKGDRSTVIYKSAKMTVRIDRVATRVCSSGELDCSTTSYDGKLTLKIGNSRQERLRQQTITVEGACGS
jgi:hypothetical protein